MLDYVRSLTLVDIGDREEVRAAGAALFVRRRDELDYNLAFDRFWRRGSATGPSQPPVLQQTRGRRARMREGWRAPRRAPASRSSGIRPARRGGASDEESEEGVAPRRSVARAGLRTKAFERMTPAELREAERLIDAVVRIPRRRTRRWKLHGRGTLLAPRQMLRRNLATGGDPITWLWRRRVTRPRGVVLLCDISGSMERHARLLLRFCHAISRDRGHAEAFCFGTRLTRITRQLRHRDPDEALASVAGVVTTGPAGPGSAARSGSSTSAGRVGCCARRDRAGGQPDGWDRGDPAEVEARPRGCGEAAIAWCGSIRWRCARYRPLAAGMAAAFPHIDVFLPAHDWRASGDWRRRSPATDRGEKRLGATLPNLCFRVGASLA